VGVGVGSGVGVGVGAGVGVGVAVGVGLGVGVGAGVDVGVGLGVGVGVGLGVEWGVGRGVGLGVGAAVGLTVARGGVDCGVAATSVAVAVGPSEVVGTASCDEPGPVDVTVAGTPVAPRTSPRWARVARANPTPAATIPSTRRAAIAASLRCNATDPSAPGC
jgi:hypothetical protein